MSARPETYVSVDVETAGPNPSAYALLAIGACLVADPAEGFYVELQPSTDAATPEAMAVSSFTLEGLRQTGRPPAEAMAAFADWLAAVVPAGTIPIFVGFNAPFDWMFVNEWFHRYTGDNPFGHRAVDIKSYAMGRDGVPLSATSLAVLAERYGNAPSLSHHALDDARVQADLFARLLDR